MDDLIQLLHEGKHSLVVANGEVCTFNGRGVIEKHPSQIKSWVRPLRHCWLWQMSKRCMRMSSVGLPLTCFQKPI